MATGACGINCDVCKLKLLDICSTCGAGKSPEATRKLEAQERILGSACPILACACLNNIEYCMRDCASFPCENFSAGPYPFSKEFLMMQERRLKQPPHARTHNKTPLTVPDEYWEKLKQKDMSRLCSFTMAQPNLGGGLIFSSLCDQLLVVPETRVIKRRLRAGERNNEWQQAEDPLLELVALLYLNGVDSIHSIGRDIVGPQDLKEAHYFQGPHALNLNPLLERYGNDLDGFRKAAEYLGGKRVDMADAAFMLLPFPRLALYYLLWQGDEEFRPKISVLFDRSIEMCLSGSGIWALVEMVSKALLRGPQ